MDRPDDKQHQEFNAKQGEPDTMTMDGLEDNVLVSYLTKDSVLVILMKSSIVDKDVTIKSLQQDHGFNLLGQHTLQLVSSQVDILYGYDVVGTKPHYKELYEGWKKSSLSDPVQVLVLEKEKAVDSFQALVNLQNSTKKKNRVMDPQSVYASINQDNVKRDINLLLGTSGSNNLGVSSAVVQPPFETVTGSMQNQDSSLSNDNNTMVNSTLDDSPVTFDTQSSAKPDLGTLEAIVNDDPSLVKKVDSDLGSSPENHIAVIDTPGSLNKTVDNDPSELSSPIAKVTTISESPATETDLSPPIAKDTNIAPESTPSPATETKLSTPTAEDNKLIDDSTTELPPSDIETEILPPTAEDNKIIDDSTTELSPSDIGTEILQPTAEDNKIIDESITKSPSDIGTEILQPTAEDNKIIDESITKSPSPTIDSDTENVGNRSTEGTTPNNVSATEKSAGNQQDSSTRQKPRDTLQANKKKQTSTVKPTTTRKVTTSDIKTNKTAAPPQPPLKSKLRTPTAAPTTRPAAAVKPPIKQKQAPSSKEKPTEGTIKKTTPRVPRVALLTPKPPPSLAKKDDEPPKRRPTTISKDAIARLAAPTASSARRQQGASVTTTPPTKGASVTATFKLEQRKIRPTRPAVTTKKTGPITGDKKETAVKKVDNKKQEPLEKITTTPSTEKTVEETAIPSPTDKAPRSPAESSTTSSRPQTPEPPAKPAMLEPKLQKPPVATNTVKNLLARFN